ncbi:MAG: O-antigen ligase family protein [Bacteroidia bacterium]|nr:O-antigen ligase family protein [Bacteroidia bacterium]
MSGCFFACILLLARATYFAFNGHPEYFFYSSFSDFIHASYFAMYLVLAITFVLVLYPKWFNMQKNILYSSYFFVLVFIITVFLCSSKLGIISLFICLPLILLYKFADKINFRSVSFSLLVLVASLFTMSKIFPTPFNRMRTMLSVSNGQIDRASSESTTVRLLIWEQSVGIIKNNLWMGVGVGDANNKLYQAYQKNGLTGAYEHKLNAHNQYLQTGVGIGLIGLIILFMLTFWQLIKAIKRRNFIAVIFALLIVLNFFVESMLQTAAGVLFFTFFYCFFNIVNQRQLEVDAV